MNSYWSKVTRTRIGRRRALIASGTAAAGAMLLAACGGSSDGKGDDRKTASLVTKPEDTIKQAKRGGIYKSSRSNDIDHSDPFFTTQAAPGTAEVYARLFRRAPGHLTSQPVEYIGDTAASWEFSPDKLRLTVKLKEGKWHTIAPVNGRTVDTADVVYTWGRLEAETARVRADLGFTRDDGSVDAMIRDQAYRGSRYSFGYPACPDLEDRAKLVELLRPERIGVELSEELQLHPEQSTDAIVVHHPEARYFAAR